MALVTLIGCLVQLYLLIGMLCIGLNAYIRCSNDCGYTTLWTQWSCDSCMNNGQNAARYRGLCCLSETKDHCLNRCHKRDEDINQFVPCHTKCMNGQLLTTTTTAAATTTTKTTQYIPSTKPSFTINKNNTPPVSSHSSTKLITTDFVSSTIDPATTLTVQSALRSTISSNSNFKTSAKESIPGTAQNSNSFSKISAAKPTVSTKRSTYLTRISTTTALAASAWTNKISSGPTPQTSTTSTRVSSSKRKKVSLHTPSTAQRFSGFISVTTKPNIFDLSSLHPSNSSLISTVQSLKEAKSSFLTKTTDSTHTQGKGVLDSASYDGNGTRKVASDRTCTWLCLKVFGNKECNTECMKPRFWNFCTILSASLFFVGVLIGAIATVIIVHCCCHNNKRKGNQQEEPKRGRKTPYPYNPGLFNAKREKRGLPKSPALTKNRRQISPTVSSSTSLIDLNWTPTSEDSPGLPQKLRSSMTEDRTGKPFGQSTQPSYNGATNMSATWDTVFEEEHWTKQKSPRHPRGNIWISD